MAWHVCDDRNAILLRPAPHAPRTPKAHRNGALIKTQNPWVPALEWSGQGRPSNLRATLPEAASKAISVPFCRIGKPSSPVMSPATFPPVMSETARLLNRPGFAPKVQFASPLHRIWGAFSSAAESGTASESPQFLFSFALIERQRRRNVGSKAQYTIGY